MNSDTESLVVEGKDCSPLPAASEEVEAWLRGLAKVVDTDALTLRLGERRPEIPEPVVQYDARSGCWWAGRYVGEIHYRGKTLRILPRFGMPKLQRWLSRIWGVRLLSSQGRYGASRTWLWELLAKLWETRLLLAAKHGLPTRRVEETHLGSSIRGRLDVRLTAREFAAGRRNLASHTRNRDIDRRIGGILLCAFEHLRRELRHLEHLTFEMRECRYGGTWELHHRKFESGRSPRTRRAA